MVAKKNAKKSAKTDLPTKKTGTVRGSNKIKKAQLAVVSSATLGRIRMSPQKVRPVVNLIKGQHVEAALQIMRYSPKKAAKATYKLLQSAVSNAKLHSGVDIDNLWVNKAYVNMSPTLKRYMPMAQGRMTRAFKRCSRITVELGVRG